MTTTVAAGRVAQENFPVAMRVLPRALRADLQATYGFARHVDDLGDDPARPIEKRTEDLRALADQVHRLYGGLAVSDPAVARLDRLTDRVPAEPWLALVDANLQDQKVDRYAAFTGLLDYCRLSANPVGRVVLHIVGQATPERLELSDHICTGLQLVEHWQDVGEDYRNGRVYLPQEDLRAFGVPEQALAADVASPAVRSLIGFECDRALAYLDVGAVLIPTLHGWAKTAVSGYLNGGRAAVRLLARQGYDPLVAVRKPTAVNVLACWARALVRSAG
jgi:squalene synthase HpnC